jgi:uncharacterized OB-fold protein
MVLSPYSVVSFSHMIYPSVSIESKAYWTGLTNGELLLQECTDCGTIRHYPRPMCDNCYSFGHRWIKASGDALVYAWTECHHAFHPSFAELTPYTLVTATLKEGPRLMAPLAQPPKRDLYLGMKLKIEFNQVSSDLTLPIFKAT